MPRTSEAASRTPTTSTQPALSLSSAPTRTNPTSEHSSTNQGPSALRAQGPLTEQEELASLLAQGNGSRPAKPLHGPRLVPSVETEACEALRFLLQLEPHQRPYVRFLSSFTVAERWPAEHADFRRLLRWWFRQLTLSPNPRRVPAPVPGSATLLWFDYRDFAWNADALRAVFQRDPRFREPGVSHPTAEALRDAIAEEQPANYHALAIADAWWFYRSTYQAVDESSYYDLLFARQRFPGGGEENDVQVWASWPGGYWAEYGAHYDAGKYQVWRKKKAAKFVDFPKDLNEWLSAFLADKAVAELDANADRIRVRHGAVCKGAEDDPQGGSSVARNNREIWFAPVPTGWLGLTFDVNASSKQRDFEENAFTDEEADKGRKIQDAGEAFITLPAGDGVAGLLIDGKQKRVEFADPGIAVHTMDSRDRRVRTVGSCYRCHMPHYGWIPLANVIERDQPNEIDTKFRGNAKSKDKDRQARERSENFDAFFLGWQWKMAHAREGPRRAVQLHTGWTGERLAVETLKWKHRYDDPVTVEQAATEQGVSVEVLRLACSDLVAKRALDLARKLPVPRRAWDDEIFGEVMKRLHAKSYRTERGK